MTRQLSSVGRPENEGITKIMTTALAASATGGARCSRASATAGDANVVNVSSAAGLQGQAGLSVYSVAKKGLVGFTEASNSEFSDEGIRSTVFLPGLVDTPLAAAYSTPPEQMIGVDDLVETMRRLVRLSPQGLIPEISFLRTDGQFGDRNDG